MVNVIDQDGDGDINFNEFVWLMTRSGIEDEGSCVETADQGEYREAHLGSGP